MRDEQVREAFAFLQILHQIDDLRLNGDIERGDRFIRHDEGRLDRDRPRDADALALPAGKLARLAVHVGGRQPNLPQKLRHFLPPLLAGAGQSEGVHRLCDDVGNGPARRQRAERILKDHLHPLAHPADLLGSHGVQILALEVDLAAVGLDEVQQQAAQRRFPAAGFPDHGQSLALHHLETDAVDGAHGGTLRTKAHAGIGKGLGQVLDLHKHAHATASMAVAQQAAR